MKLLQAGLCLFLSVVAVNSWAVLPPQYLSIPHWKQCVDTATINGGYSYVCLPNARERHCPPSSWRAFHAKKNLLPRCKI
ncbi:MAG: hypothetical protein P4M14_06535 [Gammaproteobacteria bacterium]|nr:hypothetical protein [Gammaproteobacteria bacterium]